MLLSSLKLEDGVSERRVRIEHDMRRFGENGGSSRRVSVGESLERREREGRSDRGRREGRKGGRRKSSSPRGSGRVWGLQREREKPGRGGNLQAKLVSSWTRRLRDPWPSHRQVKEQKDGEGEEEGDVELELDLLRWKELLRRLPELLVGGILKWT